MRALLLFCLVSLMQLNIAAHEAVPGYEYILQGYGITYPEQTDEEYFAISYKKHTRELEDLNDVTPFIHRKEALEKKLKLTSQQAGVPIIEENDPALGEKLNDYLELAKIYIYGVNGQFNRKKARLLLEEAKSFKVLMTEPSQKRIEEIYALLNSCMVPCSEEEKKRTGQNLKDL